MSMDRRLEYDKGPDLEEEEPPDDADDDGPFDVSLSLEDVPWKVGPLAGLGAFLAVYSVTFQLVNAVYGSISMGTEVEVGPGTLAGIVTLLSHGARLDGEASFAYGVDILFLFVPLFVAVLAVGVLVGVGYGVARYADPRSGLETAAAAAAVVPGYAGAAFVTATLATHAPETPTDASADQRIETLAIAVDSTFVLVFVAVPLAFALVGAFVANRARVLGTATSEGDDRSAGSEPLSSDG
ncbi:hypothetical protein [Natrononativus amylolyticus]|uniref:hypothetical protein n=1 Tax=Natrononativus amylolyticus TaxID=2963434 RepID=UPI0020CDA81F|nr:hypothetical protein [Natrononativus amylolyticus]